MQKSVEIYNKFNNYIFKKIVKVIFNVEFTYIFDEFSFKKFHLLLME